MDVVDERERVAEPVVLISFTIIPGAGSEAGVGWAFLEAAVARTGDPVHLLLDRRDLPAVERGLDAGGLSGRVTLHPVAVPAPVLRMYRDRRTRQSYLAWLPAARHRLRSVSRALRPSVVHQVTFASGVLPPVLGRGLADRSVWGPLAVPAASDGGRPAMRLALRAARAAAGRNLGAADLVVANNLHTRRFVEERGVAAALEPNIVVERGPARSGAVDDRRLLMAGHLVPRKRPWLAVQMLRDPRLAGFHLDVLGAGPLEPQLRALVREEGLEDRVHLHGAVSRERAFAAMSGARLLVHPSAREGSPWVVGEAAARGLAAVVMPGSGAEATVGLCANGGVVAPRRPAGEEGRALADGVVQALTGPVPAPTDRWSAARLPGLLDRWYGSGAGQP